MVHTALFLVLFTVAQVGHNKPLINVPQYMVTNPAEDYMPDVSRDGRLMVFVSSRTGAPNIWAKTISGTGIQTPLRLTFGVSGEKSPKISPDGKTMVYVSYETDDQGDIYLLELEDIEKHSEYKGVPKRLTDISTADKEPVFTIDGRSIIFTSSDKTGTEENIWIMNIKTGKKRQLTFKGGRLATPSPDGTNIMFVSARGKMNGSLYTLEFASQEEKRITKGEWIDSFPAYIDNSRVVFIRYVDDTNNDGKVSIDDNPSLFSLDIGKPDKPPLALTSSEQYNLFPAINGRYIYYSAKDGGDVDIYRVALEGVVPSTGSLISDIEQAQRIDRFYPNRHGLSLLAWRRAWSANYDNNDHGLLAHPLFSQARLLKQGGAYFLADKVLSRLITLYKDAPLYHGLARIEQITIRAEMKKHSPDNVVMSIRKISREEDAPKEVRARAKIEMASWLVKGGHYGEAVRTLRQVVAQFGTLKAISAEAAFKRNEIYSIAADRGKQVKAYIAIIRDYPGETEWVQKAEARIVEITIAPGNFQKSSVNLNAIIEKYGSLPSLQGAAMNKIAQLYYEDNELARARETFALTVQKFPNESKVKNNALFRIAEIYAEEDNFAEALKTYGAIEQDTEIKQEVYFKTRNDYIKKSLRKGWYELGLNETRIALKTFKSIIEYDASVIEAYRGLIACRVRLGETKKAVTESESKVKAHPESQALLYSLALALTYLSPPPLDRSVALIKSALRKDEREPWYHQTLGWIYEQKGRKSGDSDFLELAMIEYNYALTLTDEKAVPDRVADLRLNLGNVNYFLKNYADARNDYKARRASRVKFQSTVQEAFFYKRWGEIEYKLGDDNAARKYYRIALALSEEENIPLKIELYERLGLSNQSAREYGEAALSFIESLKLRRALGRTDNETVILRNIANNLFFLSKSEKAKDRRSLLEALDYYHESAKALRGFKDREKTRSSSLFSVEVSTGVGGLKGASKGFGEEEERKLIFHHMGRIYGELGDYKNAVKFFEKKLALTPATRNVLDNVPVLTEKAIILNQLGVYQYKLKNIGKAKSRFFESLDICHKLKSATCMINNADNLARLAIEQSGQVAAKDIGEIMTHSLEALKEAKEYGSMDNQKYGAALNHLAQIYHDRFIRGVDAPYKHGVIKLARQIKTTANDMYTAKGLYEEAMERFEKIKSVKALVAGLDISLNIATLLYDNGELKAALGKLEKTEKIARSFGIGDIEWKSKFLKYRFDPVKNLHQLKKAAEILESPRYGPTLADNNRLTLAMIRSVYHELAMGAESVSNEISILERGRGAVLKHVLSGIFREKFSNNEIEGIEKFQALFGARAELIKQKIEGVSGPDPFAAWENEYKDYVETLQDINPLLADIVNFSKFDIESVLGSLDEDEAAILFWHRADYIKLYIVTQEGVATRKFKTGQEWFNALEADTAFGAIKKIYLITDKPFSNRLAPIIAKTRMVTSIPSLASLYHFKRARSLNDFRLVAFDANSASLKEAEGRFGEAYFLGGDDVDENSINKMLSAAGALVFGRAPEPNLYDALQGKLVLNKSTEITFADLIKADISGAYIVTPGFDNEDGIDWESGTQMLSLLSGFSSWVVAPADALEREIFYQKFYSPDIEYGAFADDYQYASDEAKHTSRLLGSFGLSRAESVAKAKREFKTNIKAGVKAIKEDRWAEAADELGKALVYTRSAGETKYEALLLQKLSEVNYKLGRYKKALIYQDRLTDIYKEKGDDGALADSYLSAGIIESRLGHNDRAVKNMSSAIKIYNKNGSLTKMASTLSTMGIAQERFTRYKSALAQYQEALKINRAVGDDERIATELMRIGRIYHLRLNRFAEGRETYGKAIGIFKKIGDPKSIVRSLIDLGALEVDAGALKDAAAIFRRANKIAIANKDSQAQALTEFHLANVSWFRGEYEHAFASIRKSIKTARSIKDMGLVAMAQNSAGLIYLSLNDYAKAMESFDTSLIVSRAVGSRLDEATSLSNIGLVYRKMGRLDEALGFFKKAMLIDKELKSDWGRAHSARNLSITYLGMGNHKLAGKLAREAVRIAEKIGDRIGLARTLLQLADVIAKEGGPGSALEMYRKAAMEADETGVKEVLWRSYRGVGRSLKAMGDRPGATVAYKKAVDIVEKMRANIKSDFLKQGYLDDKQELYEELILLLLDDNAVSEAFIYSERSRARGFIDLMGMSKIRFGDKRRQNAYDKAKDLKRKLGEIDISIAMGQENENLMLKRGIIEDDYNQTLAWLRIEAPDILPFVAVEPIDPKRLLDLVGDEMILFEYVMTAKELVIFVIGDGKIDATRVRADKKETAKLVARYRKLIEDRAPIGDEAARLGKILIEPVLSKAGVSKTIGIIPHGALHYLSFASLQIKGEYLIDKTPLFYLPAASILEYTISRRETIAPGKTKVLAIGNPDLGDMNTDLPLAELEARSIRWVYPDIDIFTRGEATESRVTNRAASFNIIHIASHGQFDPLNPLQSALILAPDRQNDGALKTSEIFSLNMKADMVTLSACQTGLGKVTQGDEVVGMNRAFLFAGAHTILSTLWRVDDMASAILIKHFYRNLPKATKAMALRRAQLTIKRSFAHPAFWAGFTLVGDYK